MQKMVKSKKILFQVLFFTGFLLATAVFVFLGVKYQGTKNKVEAFTIRTGASQACFDQWCNDAVVFICELDTEEEVQQAMNGQYNCAGSNADQRIDIGNNPVSNYIPSDFCGYWQIDCNHNICGCGGGTCDSDPNDGVGDDTDGWDFIGGFDSSGCNEEPQPYCGDGIVSNGEQCDPASSQNTCGGETCNSNCTCGSTPQLCPHSSTEARVQCEPWQDCPWAQSLTVDEGETFRVASFHNGTDTPASDTRLIVTDPNGAEVLNCQPNGNPYTCNTSVVTANTPGTYTLQVQTPGYNVSACQASAQVIVSPTSQNPNYEIVKDIVDPDNFYFIGDYINFRVTIRNIGETAFDVVSFRDTYDPSRIDYISVQGRKSGGTNINLTASVNEAAGTISITDLTAQLGNLAPGENYILTFRFRALSETSRTCNSAFTNPDNLGEEGDDVCLAINRPPDL